LSKIVASELIRLELALVALDEGMRAEFGMERSGKSRQNESFASGAANRESGKRMQAGRGWAAAGSLLHPNSLFLPDSPESFFLLDFNVRTNMSSEA
jgi:hypothetical protein